MPASSVQLPKTQINNSEPISLFHRPYGLIAKWLLEEGKPVCHWFPAQL